MAKFTGENIVATFGSATWLCITSVEVNETADIYTENCAGSSYKVRAVGPIDATITVNFLADTAGSEYTSFRPGTSGTFTASINGTYSPQYEAACIVESLGQPSPVGGFVSGSVSFVVDGALTVS